MNRETNLLSSAHRRVLTMCLSALLAVSAGLATAREASAQNCMGDAAGNPSLNCTANDLTLATFIVTNIQERCRKEGDTMTFDGKIRLNASPVTRYDLGFYVGYDNTAMTGTCAVAIIDPFDTDEAGQITTVDGDACGEFLGAANDVPMNNITAVCRLNGNGFFDLAVCASYDINTKKACNSVADAFPSNSSKCQCSRVQTDQQPVRCASNADCDDDGDPCTASICNEVGGDAYGCTYQNAADGTSCNDGTFCNGVDVCTGGSCTHPGDPCTGGPSCGNVCNEAADNCFLTAGTPCRSANGVCDVSETCSGTSATCPADAFVGTTTTCRTSAGECDVAEVCSGTGASCPADSFAVNSTPCSTDSNVCTDDLCDGSGACGHPNNTAPCDDGIFCNGTDTCSAGTCGHDGDPCLGGASCGNVCNESADNCFVTAGTLCRAAVGVCDTAEICTGASLTCPDDAFLDDTTVCRGGNGVCNPEETCSGTSGSCPADDFAAPSTPCDDNLFCNGDDTCSGGFCSVHSGDPCGGGGECSGSCDETANDCNLAGSAEGNPCSDDGNVCTDDICNAENECSHPNNTAPCDDSLFCNGTDTCADGVCEHAGNPCLGGPSCGDVCNESANNCFVTAGTLCRAALGVCDAAETCTGTDLSCPSDAFLDNSTVCRAANGVCDPAETCTGAGGSCPADAFASDSTPCASDANVCTDDFCTGSGACGHASNNAPCDDGLYCTGDDTCSNGTCGHTGDPCTGGPDCADTCDEAADACFDPIDTPCDDDGNACTEDTCTGAGICQHTNDDGAPCDDGLFCNGADVCAGGICTHGSNPCSGECKLTCIEATQTCADPAGTGCTSDSNECTRDECDGDGNCTHPADNTATCDDGVYCNGADTCQNAICVHAGDPCTGGPACGDSCNELDDNCFPVDGTPCFAPCLVPDTGICVGGTCEGDEPLLSPSCRWLILAGVGDVPADNTVQTAGVLNSSGSVMAGDSCGFDSKKSRGIMLGSFVVTAEQNEGRRGIGIKFAQGANVYDDIVTAGSTIKSAKPTPIPGTFLATVGAGVTQEKLNSLLVLNDTYVDTTGAHPLVTDCATDLDKMAAAIAVLDALPSTRDLGKYKLRPKGTVELEADGMTVFDATFFKLGGYSTLTLTGDADDVVVFRSAGSVLFGSEVTLVLNGIDENNVLFYGQGKACKIGRAVRGKGTWFCPYAKKFQIGTSALWGGSAIGGTRSVKLKRRAQLTFAPFTAF